MTSMFKIKCQAFNALNLEQLYAILKLRQNVFILEQRSIYADVDDADQASLHLCAYAANKLVGYTRLRAQDPQVYKIERVVCLKEVRGQGLGQKLMHAALNKITSLAPGAAVRLSAQTEALAFYQTFGFIPQGQSYDDGGIEHMDMQLTPGNREFYPGSEP